MLRGLFDSINQALSQLQFFFLLMTLVPTLSASPYILNSTGSGYSELNLLPGKYLIEMWGASGGIGISSDLNSFGLGGYTSGEILFSAPRVVSFYIGTRGKNAQAGNVAGAGGYNGGGIGGIDNVDQNGPGGGGGGATDMRLVKGSFNDPTGLLSRIMVAGGGGGGAYPEAHGGNAGGLNGFAGAVSSYGTLGGAPGTQIGGYALGQGGAGSPENEAGGGGGLYGGLGGLGGGVSTGTRRGGGGGGGSSYITGFSDVSGTCASHMSGFLFSKAKIISGGSTMPSPTEISSIIVGHVGDGVIRITQLVKGIGCTCPILRLPHWILFVLLLLSVLSEPS